MSRLIDADKLIEDLNNITLEMDLSQLQKLESVQQLIKRVTFNVHTIMMAHIDEQPTAYDIEKVVAELEEKSDDIPIQYEDNYEKGFDDGIGYAIDTVRKGGI